jgi:hypothetical protein
VTTDYNNKTLVRFGLKNKLQAIGVVGLKREKNKSSDRQTSDFFRSFLPFSDLYDGNISSARGLSIWKSYQI